jgi:hypothetical protein
MVEGSMLSDIDIISEATKYSGRQFTTSPSQYVCHTSTIPFASTANPIKINKQRVCPLVSHFHGHANDPSDRCCSMKKCMFVSKTKVRKGFFLPENCPCQNRGEDAIDLKPICFLSYLQSLNRNLSSKEDAVEICDIDPNNIDSKTVMFCFDAQSIFDESYNGPMRTLTGLTGFSHIKKKRDLIKVLQTLYWYCKYDDSYQLTRYINGLDMPIEKICECVKQSIHSINGFLLKKFFVFGPECVGYSQIADETARLFKDFIFDYTCSSNSNSIFLESKDFFNFVKEKFNHPSLEGRMLVFQYPFKNKALERFFSTELKRLLALIDKERQNCRDYTKSLAWMFRSTHLCQTRVLGYVPNHLAVKHGENFWLKVERPTEELDPEIERLIHTSVKESLKNGKVPQGIFNTSDPEILEALYKEIEIELKLSSSCDHTFVQGGKLEDARQLLRLAKKNNWKIPVRNLHNFSIEEIMEPITDEVIENGDINLSRYLFNIAIQISINFLVERDLMSEEFYYELLDGLEDYASNLLNCSIIHINEPGKLRSLVKSKALLSWVLAPGAKMMSNVIAILPSHMAGLKAAAHDWTHTARMSALSNESAFMFDADGYIRSSINFVYKDWTEATDFIGKRKGVAHLRGFLEYTGFPRAYGELIMKLIREPQIATESCILNLDSFESEDVFSPISHFKRHGIINEGFMMGLQVTKIILHLLHLSEQAITFHFLKMKGIKFKETSQREPVTIDQGKRITRDMEDLFNP